MTCEQERDVLQAEVKRLRKIEVAVHAWANAAEAAEEADEDSTEYIDACHAVFHALGRTSCTSCQT